MVGYNANTIELARFGGGESFSGGFSGGSSFSGLGGGGFSGFPIIIPIGNSCSGSNCGVSSIFSFLFILIFFFVIFRVLFSNRRGSININQRDYTSVAEADISSLEELDPHFSKERFLDHVQALFFQFQQSWTNGDLSPTQPYLTQSMYTRLKTQLDQLNQKNEQDVMENIAIGGMKIVKVKVDEDFEYLTIQIDAAMKDYKIDKTTKKVVEGNQNSTDNFTEYWEFIRSKTVQSDYTKGFVAQTCPNCGAPIEVNEFGQCKYCKAAITSGSFDWVLDAIYQAGEFHG